ncbi:MAG: phosphatidylserine decarboxylase family protein [Syntrophomonadaceae bacterium]|nr:phosphatidylserine decarboxylase family protein [Syntrophomonadaceae bacterium]
MKQYPVAKEGWSIIIVLLLISLLTGHFFGWWAILPFTAAIFTVFFFRNPQRSIPDMDGIFVSPADGVIINIEQQHEDRYLGEEAVKISIFLSLFNVHVNRSPVEGKVAYLEQFSGKNLPANRLEAGHLNVKNCMGLESEWGKVMVVQITGLIARRLVCWARVGDQLERGERFGLIKFGSCTEIYLPKNIVLNVKPGDRVKGGATTLGRFE